MDFLPDADQHALIDATREYIASRFPLTDWPSIPSDVRWKEISELGWLGLATAEEAGGAGATLVDEAFVFREIGGGLVVGPILTTLAAARLAAWTANLRLAAELIGGQIRVARAVHIGGVQGALLLNDADGSELTLLVGEESAGLYTTPAAVELAPGLEDGTWVGRARVSDLDAAVVRTDNQPTVARLKRVLSILTSAQLAGIAGATSQLATEYAKNRVQFGKPIGAFQAIKHRCADMATNALAADNVMFFAALAETMDGPSGDYNSLAAATFCRRVAFANARANVQIHGAMGFTVEDSAHRFVKRTHALCATEGFEHSAARLGACPHPDRRTEE